MCTNFWNPKFSYLIVENCIHIWLLIVIKHFNLPLAMIVLELYYYFHSHDWFQQHLFKNVLFIHSFLFMLTLKTRAEPKMRHSQHQLHQCVSVKTTSPDSATAWTFPFSNQTSGSHLLLKLLLIVQHSYWPTEKLSGKFQSWV